MTADQPPPNDTGAPDTSRAYIERMIQCDPFADQTAGIPEMVATLRALLAESRDLSAAREAAAALEMRKAAIARAKDLPISEIAVDEVVYALEQLPLPDAAALDRMIAEVRREAVEATWRDVEAALEKEINAEWFTSEVNGKPVTSKGETEFMRLTEAKRVFDMLKANVRAARGSREGRDG